MAKKQKLPLGEECAERWSKINERLIRISVELGDKRLERVAKDRFSIFEDIAKVIAKSESLDSIVKKFVEDLPDGKRLGKAVLAFKEYPAALELVLDEVGTALHILAETRQDYQRIAEAFDSRYLRDAAARYKGSELRAVMKALLEVTFCGEDMENSPRAVKEVARLARNYRGKALEDVMHHVEVEKRDIFVDEESVIGYAKLLGKKSVVELVKSVKGKERKKILDWTLDIDCYCEDRKSAEKCVEVVAQYKIQETRDKIMRCAEDYEDQRRNPKIFFSALSNPKVKRAINLYKGDIVGKILGAIRDAANGQAIGTLGDTRAGIVSRLGYIFGQDNVRNAITRERVSYRRENLVQELSEIALSATTEKEIRTKITQYLRERTEKK